MGKLNINIVPTKVQKYVLVFSKKDEETVIHLRGNPTAEWHNDIVKEIISEGYNSLKVEGGGRIMLLPERKTIYFWDKSTMYGEALAIEVKMLLESKFPEYEIYNFDPSNINSLN